VAQSDDFEADELDDEPASLPPEPAESLLELFESGFFALDDELSPLDAGASLEPLPALGRRLLP
jgi:hypothetical protein